MTSKKNILGINGSASERSANKKLIDLIEEITKDYFNLHVFNLKSLPHFDPELSIEDTPAPVLDFRSAVAEADGVLICTPEYVFSIPSGLKNAIEWCVSTTVFSDKPLGIITASASGIKGHEELQMIMRTIMAKFTAETTLLIQGVKGKLSEGGEITDTKTRTSTVAFIAALKALVLKEDSGRIV